MDPNFLHLFAQHLGTEPERAAEELDRFVTSLATSLKLTGRSDVPGLGAFRVVKGHVAFVPAVEVANEVNARYAGLEDVLPPPQARFAEPEKQEDAPTPSEPGAVDASDHESSDEAAPEPVADDAIVEAGADEPAAEERAEGDEEPAGVEPLALADDAFGPVPTPTSELEGLEEPSGSEEDATQDAPALLVEEAPVEHVGVEQAGAEATPGPQVDAVAEAEDEASDEREEEAAAIEAVVPELVAEPEPEEMPVAVSALSLADMLGEDAEPEEMPAVAERPADDWEGIWAPADEPNAQPLGPTAEADVEEAQFDVVAATSPPTDGPVENVEVETIDAPRQEDPSDESGGAASARVPRKKKKRVKAVSVSRDFLREREAERRAALERQRKAAVGEDSPAKPAAEGPDVEAPVVLADPPAPEVTQPAPLPAVPPAVAALQSKPSDVRTELRRLPERERERNWLLPALLGLVAVLMLIGWLANGEEAPDAVPEPAPVAAAPADEAPVVEAPLESAAALAEEDTGPADPFEAPLRGSGGIDAARGGFTWVVTRDGATPAAQAAKYAAAGYRASVLRSAANGRTIERVCLGQFRTSDEAMAAQADLPDGVPADRWLFPLSP